MPDREDAGHEMNVGLPSNVPLPPQLNLSRGMVALSHLKQTILLQIHESR